MKLIRRFKRAIRAFLKEESAWIPVCPECGSKDLTQDATIYFNHETREWEIGNTYDDCWCQNCEDTGGCGEVRRPDWILL